MTFLPRTPTPLGLRDGPADLPEFEALYSRNPDPWNFATSGYERERYAATLKSLQSDRYAAAFEPGCSVGELTALLAARCDRLLAIDVAPSAIARARARCAHLPQVELRCADVWADVWEFPAPSFDLIVFSEIGYYVEPLELARFASTVPARLAAQGEFVAVHWLGHSKDHCLHGDAVHDILLERLPLRWIGGSAHPGFRIDTWRKPDTGRNSDTGRKSDIGRNSDTGRNADTGRDSDTGRKSRES
jgi:cyclopropane fatty-acyl-phospholipid synthase-like methyltransferase